MSEPACRVLRTRRIFPADTAKQPTTTKLSILDASVVRFASCSAIWLYDRAEGADAHDPVVFERMEEALRHTLDGYPHYSGQLRYASKQLVEGDVNPRHVGRPVVVYGTAEDPGLELVVAEDGRELSAIVPSQQERSTVKKVWIATDFPQNEFLANTKLAFSTLADFEGLPGVAIQLTAFKCGGFAVSVKLAHCLSDATCLMQFVHSWAAQSRLLSGDDQSKAARIPVPLFDPRQLDQHANLAANSTSPDPERVSKARALPMHRYDWWASDAPGYPSWAAASSDATRPPTEELARLELSPSAFPPWPAWNMAAPVEHVQIRFQAEAIAKMKRAAEASLPESLNSQRVSRLDAALAHIWILVNRARQLEMSEEEVYMDITLGLRARVEPPLPETFVGSPILLAYIAKTGSEASTATIGSIAGSIRQTMSQFTPDAVSAYIHDAAHEVSPQRLWQSFLGSRHTLVTSWVRARAYEVDFCATGQLARYVQGVMPRLDGLVQVMDIAETGDFDISVCLEKDTLKRLIQDPMLKAYGI
ncbi:transferase family protein [Hypoxylon crocopeplum]|nr:transferase family protein [Hypoxylon crocopeplum]